MMELKLRLSKKLENQLNHLEKISQKSKEFIIQEALIQYIEDMEDIQKYSVLEEILEKKTKNLHHRRTYQKTRTLIWC